jgi:ATP-dependent DNA helicase RecQ
MQFLRLELDDPEADACGRCAVCAGDFVPRQVDPGLLQEAAVFLRRAHRPIEPRKRWPTGSVEGRAGAIALENRLEPGRALSIAGDAGWGRLVADSRRRAEPFPGELIEAAAALLEEVWRPDPAPEWVVGVPSRGPLVADLASRLADRLGLPYRPALLRTRDTVAQSELANSHRQLRNVAGAFTVEEGLIAPGPVLLLDDTVESRWSITECGLVLRRAGSGLVYPLVLADSSRGG